MLRDQDVSNYIKVRSQKLEHLFKHNNDATVLYQDFYNNIENEHLRKIFILLHTTLNDLFEFMYNKYGPEYGGHYNADQSRELIEVIKQINLLKANLKNTQFYFQIDPYYEELINLSKTFLSPSGGSSIPQDFPENQLIDYREIFTLSDIVNVKRMKFNDNYQLKNIGSGSYANVYKFKDSYYNKWVVIKRAKKELNSKELERFKNEYLETKKLNSPYIIQVYNYDNEKNEYSMEYANQKTLSDYISKKNTLLTMRERVLLISQLFRAFIYIHSKGLLHRDISYHNILVNSYDDVTLIKIADFGLVKIADSNLTSKDSVIKGSLNDPDLHKVGFSNYEVRHEIYALTQVINFVICGKKISSGLFNRDNHVNSFLSKGLESDINKRYKSVEEMNSEFLKIKNSLLKL